MNEQGNQGECCPACEFLKLLCIWYTVLKKVMVELNTTKNMCITP